uniref:Uncharacterized protein n=1 Tax=viral metagenome TaxID=1070528 RepID=A0A6C0DZ30_9ZZZZ
MCKYYHFQFLCKKIEFTIVYYLIMINYKNE